MYFNVPQYWLPEVQYNMSHEGKIKIFAHNSQSLLNNCSGRMQGLADRKLHDQGFTVETIVMYVSAFFSSRTTVQKRFW